MMTRDQIQRFLITLSLAAGGGALFYILQLPLPWTLGALTAVGLSTLRFTPYVPINFRNIMSSCLGIMLGSGFSPAMVDRFDELGLSFIFLLLLTAIGGACAVMLARQLTRLDPATTYFMAMPGGLNDMANIGHAMGADSRAIAINHSLRIMLTVWTVPVLLPIFTGITFTRTSLPLHADWPSLIELAGLALCAIGWPLAHRIKLPAAQIMGPMLVSSLAHLLGLLHTAPPTELVILAQIVMGGWLGARFLGTQFSDLRRLFGVAFIMTSFLLILAIAGSYGASLVTGLSWPTLLLAYAPGGLAEMSLTALALDLDASIVALHHLVRVVMVLLIGPLIFKFWLYPRRTD